MGKFFITLSVMPKHGVLDPAGVAVKNTLDDLGFHALESVVLGKCLYLTLEAADEAAAKNMAQAMAKNLLAHEAMEEVAVLAMKELKG